MKFLIHSNHPSTPSGYGKQAGLFGTALRDAGHEVIFTATSGASRIVTEHNGMTVYGRGEHELSIDAMLHDAERFRPDYVITLLEFWGFDANAVQKELADMGVMWIAWIPVDADPISYHVQPNLGAPDKLWCFSDWGTRVLWRNGYIDAEYVPLAASPEIVSASQDHGAREKTRAWLGVEPDQILIGNVAAPAPGEISRKSHHQLIHALALLPDDYVLYMHMPAEANDIDILAAQQGVVGRIMYAERRNYLRGFYDEQDMGRLYAAFDVMALPSASEGFGVPLVEAQACGCPVVAGGWTSMPELVEAGRVLEEQTPIWVPHYRTYWHLPDPREISNCIEDAAMCGRRSEDDRVNYALKYDPDFIVRDMIEHLL